MLGTWVIKLWILKKDCGCSLFPIEYASIAKLLTTHVTGADDDQFEEEKELIIKEIERVSRLPNLET